MFGGSDNAKAAALPCGETEGWWVWAKEQDLIADPRISKMADVMIFAPDGQRLFAPSQSPGRKDKAGLDKEGGSVDLRSKRRTLKLEFDGKPFPTEGFEGKVMEQVGERRPEMRYVQLLATWKWQGSPGEIAKCGLTSQEEFMGGPKAIEAYVRFQRQEWIRKKGKNDGVHPQTTLPPPPKPPTASTHDRERQTEFTFVKTAGRNWELRPCSRCDDRM